MEENKKSKKEKSKARKVLYIIWASIRYAFLAFVLFITTIITFAFRSMDIWSVTYVLGLLTFAAFGLIVLFPIRKIKWKAIIFGGLLALFLIVYGSNALVIEHEENITIKTDVNINTKLYLPFDDDSLIARLPYDASLKLEGDLPILDGASAAFPVYSAVVNEVYPEDANYDLETFSEGPFQFRNTVGGYMALAEGKVDIFFGAYPSQEQIDYAKKCGVEFEYTQIGNEAFVFFVNSNNEVSDLSIEEIRNIYSGNITNWNEVGGNNKEIVPYQRNKNSGSQSMMVRFMGNTPLMDPPKHLVNDTMTGIIDVVSDYHNTDGAIGFSFRYYLDTIINNPDVKMISINGAYPSYENIKNGTYPVVAPVYAVTIKGNDKESVKTLIDWLLSSEGQELIELSGYAGVK